MFDDKLLKSFMDGFFGYGNYRGDYWFIGMEEGGGKTPDEITKRLSAWETRGRNELEDLAEFHLAFDRERFSKRFMEPVVLSRTWRKLIQILLIAAGEEPSTETVKEYQRERLGRQNGDSCLLELLSLPSPRTDYWHYSTFSTLPCLVDRETYRKNVRPHRIRHLRKRIEDYRPKVVVFYSTTYRKHWAEIISPVDVRPTGPEGILTGSDGTTLFAVVRHPSARGITNSYFDGIGHLISRKSD